MTQCFRVQKKKKLVSHKKKISFSFKNSTRQTNENQSACKSKKTKLQNLFEKISLKKNHQNPLNSFYHVKLVSCRNECDLKNGVFFLFSPQPKSAFSLVAILKKIKKNVFYSNFLRLAAIAKNPDTVLFQFHFFGFAQFLKLHQQ